MRQNSLRFGAIAAVILGIFCYVPSIYAQCPTDGSGDAIQCRMGNLLDRHGAVLSKLQERMSSCSSNGNSDPHCDALKRHLARAQNAHTRALNTHKNTAANDYNQLTLKPHYKRNSNRKGGSGNSVETMDTDYDQGAPDTAPNSVGQTLCGSLDDATSAMDDATVQLSATPTPPHQTWTDQTKYDYIYDPEYPAWLHTEDEKAFIITLFAMKTAENALAEVTELAEDACKQDAVILGEGGNGSLGCMALTIAHAAVRTTADLLELSHNDSTFWNAHGAYMNAGYAIDATNKAGQRANDAANASADVEAKVDAINHYIDNTLNPDLIEIKASLKKLHDEVLTNQALLRETLKVLLTPDGKKILDPGITTCVGANCPNVLSQCSSIPCAFPIR